MRSSGGLSTVMGFDRSETGHLASELTDFEKFKALHNRIDATISTDSRPLPCHIPLVGIDRLQLDMFLDLLGHCSAYAINEDSANDSYRQRIAIAHGRSTRSDPSTGSSHECARCPADHEHANNTAATGGQGSDLQSVMGSLVENGLQASLSADETELPLFSQVKDKTGQVLSPEAKAQIANKLTTVMMRQLTAAATPAASPRKTMTGPMQTFQHALAVSVANASSGVTLILMRAT